MAKLHPFSTQGTLTEANITTTQTSFTEASFAALPVVASPDIVELIFDPYNVYGHQERVIVTAHTSGSSSATLTRGAYGSTRSAHNSSGATETWWCAVTDQDLIHANLANLTSDDHTQYALANGSRAFTGAITVPSITGSGDPLAITDDLSVTGSVTAAGSVTAGAAASVGTNLSVTGNITAGGNASVSGTSSLAGLVTNAGGIATPQGRVYLNSGSISTTQGIISMNQSSSPGYVYNMTSGLGGLEITEAGSYFFACQLEITIPNGSTVWLQASLYYNNNPWSTGTKSTQSGPFTGVATHSDVIPCQVGDVVNVGGRASSASTCNLAEDGAGVCNYLSGFRVSGNVV